MTVYRSLVFKAYATSFTFDLDVKNRTLTAQGTKSLKDQHPSTFINRQRGSDYLKSPNLVLDHYVYHFIRRSHVTTREMLTFAAFDLRIYGHRCQDVAKLYIGSSCESNWTLSFCSTSDTFCVLKTSHETTWKYKYTSSYEEIDVYYEKTRQEEWSWTTRTIPNSPSKTDPPPNHTHTDLTRPLKLE